MDSNSGYEWKKTEDGWKWSRNGGYQGYRGYNGYYGYNENYFNGHKAHDKNNPQHPRDWWNHLKKD